MRTKTITWITVLLGLIPIAKAQPYWMYWFTEAFGVGLHGGSRTIDFLVFFVIFTSIIYLGAKNMLGDKEGKTSKAVIALSAALGLALTMALVMNTQFSLALFYPFAKNLIFFIFIFILYAFLVKYGGMEKNKIWAFVAALVIGFLIFNVGNCFISERASDGSCTPSKIFSGIGKPFEAIGDWFGDAFKSGKKDAGDFVENLEKDASSVIDDVIPKDEEEKLKKQSCEELVKQAESPSLLCDVQEIAIDVYNMCTGGKGNPYSDITRWRVANEKCTEAYNAADENGKKKLGKLVAKTRTHYEFLQGLAAKEGEDYEKAITHFDKVINDAGVSSSLKSKATGLKTESEKLKNEKEFGDTIKGAEDAIRAGEEFQKQANKNTNPGEKLQLFGKAVESYTKAKTDMQEVQKGGASK